MRDFIKVRMNKDNFWNLMFAVIIVGGTAIAFLTNILILSWFAIAISIWLAKRSASIVFDKKKLEFVINNNKKLKASGGELIILTFVSFGVIAAIGLILDNLKIEDSPLILAAMMSLLILFPVLYCIIRNLPIGVYFKKEAWISTKYTNGNNFYSEFKHTSGSRHRSCLNNYRATNTQTSMYSNGHKSYSGNTRDSIITSPAMRSYSSNIYHRK